MSVESFSKQTDEWNVNSLRRKFKLILKTLQLYNTRGHRAHSSPAVSLPVAASSPTPCSTSLSASPSLLLDTYTLLTQVYITSILRHLQIVVDYVLKIKGEQRFLDYLARAADHLWVVLEVRKIN